MKHKLCKLILKMYKVSSLNLIYKNVEINLFLKYLYNLLGLSFNSDNFTFCYVLIIIESHCSINDFIISIFIL